MSQAMPSAPQAEATTAPVTTPADGQQAATSEEGSRTLDSTDDIAAFLGSDTDHQSDTAATAQPDLSSDQDGQQAQEAPPETETAQEQAAAVQAPASWPKEEKEAFAKLPPDIQQVITRRETERDGFVKAKSEEAAQARTQHDKLLGWTQSNLNAALQQAQASIMADYADIDMLALQRENPSLYMQVDAEIKGRYARLNDVVKKHQEVLAYQNQENTVRQQAMLKEEMKGVKERLATINGKDADVKAWKTEAENFLKSIGCPDDHIAGISNAYQIDLIARAMQYDKMKANAASATQKVADAPKVMRPAGPSAPAGQSSKEKDAWRAFNSNPKSTGNIANLLSFGV